MGKASRRAIFLPQEGGAAVSRHPSAHQTVENAQPVFGGASALKGGMASAAQPSVPAGFLLGALLAPAAQPAASRSADPTVPQFSGLVELLSAALAAEPQDSSLPGVQPAGGTPVPVRSGRGPAARASAAAPTASLATDGAASTAVAFTMGNAIAAAQLSPSPIPAAPPAETQPAHGRPTDSTEAAVTDHTPDAVPTAGIPDARSVEVMPALPASTGAPLAAEQGGARPNRFRVATAPLGPLPMMPSPAAPAKAMPVAVSPSPESDQSIPARLAMAGGTARAERTTGRPGAVSTEAAPEAATPVQETPSQPTACTGTASPMTPAWRQGATDTPATPVDTAAQAPIRAVRAPQPRIPAGAKQMQACAEDAPPRPDPPDGANLAVQPVLSAAVFATHPPQEPAPKTGAPPVDRARTELDAPPTAAGQPVTTDIPGGPVAAASAAIGTSHGNDAAPSAIPPNVDETRANAARRLPFDLPVRVSAAPAAPARTAAPPAEVAFSLRLKPLPPSDTTSASPAFASPPSASPASPGAARPDRPERHTPAAAPVSGPDAAVAPDALPNPPGAPAAAPARESEERAAAAPPAPPRQPRADEGDPASAPAGATGHATPLHAPALERVPEPEARPAALHPAPELRPAATVEPLSHETLKPAAPIRSLEFQLDSVEGRVAVRFADRAGEVKVDVRTPDSHLASTLRADLPELAAKIEQTGYRAEVWQPATSSAVERGRVAESAASSGDFQHQPQGGQGDSQEQQRHDPPAPEQTSPRKDNRKDFQWLFTSIR